MITAFIPHESYFGVFNSQGVVLTALYLMGIMVAVVVSFALKKTLYRTERGTFIMEMPTYKLPNARSVLIRVYNRARSFVLRAGTVILAITIIIWALGYYPRSETITSEYDTLRREVYQDIRQERARANPNMVPADSTEQWELTEAEQGRLDQLTSRETGAHVRNSYFARIGRTIEPVFRPLGWDWKITMSVLASVPAREVTIATLGTIFNLGSDVDESSMSLVDKMRNATWDSGEQAGLSLFSPAVALSIMVFFALSCQCGATLVTIRQEAGGWRYAVFVFVYMTLLGYVGALAVYQLFRSMGF
jgi:ferrous iron transport protein B